MDKTPYGITNTENKGKKVNKVDELLQKRNNDYIADMLRNLPEGEEDVFKDMWYMQMYGYKPSIDMIQRYNYHINEYNKKMEYKQNNNQQYSQRNYNQGRAKW